MNSFHVRSFFGGELFELRAQAPAAHGIMPMPRHLRSFHKHFVELPPARASFKGHSVDRHWRFQPCLLRAIGRFSKFLHYIKRLKPVTTIDLEFLQQGGYS